MGGRETFETFNIPLLYLNLTELAINRLETVTSMTDNQISSPPTTLSFFKISENRLNQIY